MIIQWWSPGSRQGVLIRVGPWQVKVSWPNGGGRYCNGSRWHSPIHRWANEPDY